MDDYQILFSKKAQKDIDQLTSNQKAKLKEILQQVLAINPYMGKALKGKIKWILLLQAYSKRPYCV